MEKFPALSVEKTDCVFPNCFPCTLNICIRNSLVERNQLCTVNFPVAVNSFVQVAVKQTRKYVLLQFRWVVSFLPAVTFTVHFWWQWQIQNSPWKTPRTNFLFLPILWSVPKIEDTREEICGFMFGTCYLRPTKCHDRRMTKKTFLQIFTFIRTKKAFIYV